MKIKITNSEIQEILTGESSNYPKYTTQIMNLANQNSQGTRSRVVGQISDLIQEFDGHTLSEWEEWYKERYPESLDIATDKIYCMIEQLRDSIQHIDKTMVRRWVEELVIEKSFAGLKFQSAIIQHIAKSMKLSSRLATPEEESIGIDGYIGGCAVSVKPTSYLTKKGLSEQINVAMIYYTKNKSNIEVEYNIGDDSKSLI